MPRSLIVLAAFAAALVVAPTAAHSICTITEQPGFSYPDSDCDGVRDSRDNCPLVRNGDCDKNPEDCDMNENKILSDLERSAGDQVDWNDDGKGDACADTDGDGHYDYEDNCRGTFNPAQNRSDCTDTDGDGIEDSFDNCAEIPNSSQTNTDGDPFGDACDVCPFLNNPGQGRYDCPKDTANPADPDESAPNEPQDQEIDYGNALDHVSGSGGCSLAPDVAFAPWSALIFAAAAAVAAIRRRR